jgi:hypothetical protein
MFARHARSAVVLIVMVLTCSYAVTPSSALAQPVTSDCVAQPPPTSGQAPIMHCYGTFAAAIVAATDGAVRLPSSTPAGPLPAWAVAATLHGHERVWEQLDVDTVHRMRHL